jgi:succinate dehydrogenase/fumarate reductase cytochrome b subunit
MPAPATSADRWLARSHALLGAGLLGGFLIYHLLQLWPVLDARETWVANASGGGQHLLAGWVLVVLVVHGVLGAMRIARSKGAELSRDERGLRSIQAISGVLIGVFVVYHVAHVWGLDAEPHGSARAVYHQLWSSLGHPLQMSAYLLGISLACFHFGHGLSRMALGWGSAPPSSGRRLVVRVLAGVIGFGLWALWLQLLAHFAIGQRLF